MADFSIGDVAFTGFRVIRERPKAFGVWVAIQVVYGLVMLLLTARFLAPEMQQLQQATAVHPADPRQSLAAMAALTPYYVMLLLISLLIYPVIYAAMNRAILRPSDDRYAYLRVGADELRQLGLMLLYLLIMFALYIGSAIVGVIAGLIAAAAVGGLAQSPAAGSVLMVFLIVLIMGVVMAFVGVRLSLASPLTFASGKIDLFGSWTLTKGRFWPIFGTLVVVICISFAIYVLIAVIAAAVTFATGGGGGLFNVFTHPDYSSTSGFLTPARIALQLISAVFGAVFIPLWITPPAAIFASIASASTNSAAGRARLDEVFS